MPKNEAKIKEDFIRKAKKFWIHQIFAGLGVDLERGNDTMKYVKQQPWDNCALLEGAAAPRQ